MEIDQGKGRVGEGEGHELSHGGASFRISLDELVGNCTQNNVCRLDKDDCGLPKAETAQKQELLVVEESGRKVLSVAHVKAHPPCSIRV